MEEQRQHPHKGPVDGGLEGQPAGGAGRPEHGRGEGPAPAAIKGKLWLARLWWGQGFAAPFLSRSAPARDLARLPFCGAAAISRGRGGQGGGGGARPARAGRGWRQRRGCPRGSASQRVPFVLRLRVRGVGLRLCPGCARGRVNPPKSRREACAGRTISSALEAFPEWDSPPHPCCVKGIHFRRQCSALNRGKLECHPEKQGASRSLVLLGVAAPFACPALNHNGASAQRSDIAQRRQWENQQRC